MTRYPQIERMLQQEPLPILVIGAGLSYGQLPNASELARRLEEYVPLNCEDEGDDQACCDDSACLPCASYRFLSLPETASGPTHPRHILAEELGLPNEERQELRQNAEQWSAWLSKPRPDVAHGTPDPKLEEGEQRLGALIKSREEILKFGEAMRPHRDHLLQTRTFIEKHWKTEHGDLCPTCRSHFPNGIEAVIEPWFQELDQKINEARNQYKELSEEIRNLGTTLKVSSQTQCPVPELDRRRIENWLTAVLGDSIRAEQLLGSTDQKEPTLRLFRFLEAPPKISDIPQGIPEEAQRLADTIGGEWAEAQIVSAAPDAWENVQKRLQHVLKEVVESHLPRTFQAIWREIMSTLRPGAWVFPEVPILQPDLRRGKQRIDVVIGKEGHLARYLLNGAEFHTLGLAWFFTRHIVESRFRHGWMLLDDPAQEMDQPTFRELCRFLATLRRIYEFHGRKQGETKEAVFTLLVLLHQEERALDMARELGAGLHLLGWSRNQDDEGETPTVRRLLLTGPGYECPQPKWAMKPAG